MGLLFFTGERPCLCSFWPGITGEEEAVLEAAGLFIPVPSLSITGGVLTSPYLAARMRFFGLPPVKIPHHLDLFHQTSGFPAGTFPTTGADCRPSPATREEPDGLPAALSLPPTTVLFANGDPELMGDSPA